MPMDTSEKSKTEKDTALAELIAAAPTKVLSELILNLGGRPCVGIAV